MSSWYYESDGDINNRTHYLTNDANERLDFDSRKEAEEYLYTHLNSRITCKYCKAVFSESQLEESYGHDSDGMEHPVNNICPKCHEPDCYDEEEEMTNKPKLTEVVFTTSGREYHCDAGWENDGAYGALKSKGNVRMYHTVNGDTCLTLEHPVYLKAKYIEAQGTVK